MKKLLSIGFVVMCLMLSSIALAADMKPLKCTYEAGVVGTMEFPGRGFQMWTTGAKVVITVLEKKAIPFEDPDDPNATIEMYRFSAEYDNPSVACSYHGTHMFEDVKENVAREMWDNFLLPVEDAKCD